VNVTTVPTTRRAVRLLEAIRAFGVVSGGPIVLALFALTGIAWVIGAVLGGERPPLLAIVGTVGFFVYLGVLPWQRRWGATRAENPACPGPRGPLQLRVARELPHFVMERKMLLG
jgi:hypothetical protein